MNTAIVTPSLMLINNGHVAGLQEKTAAAVYRAFGTISAAMIDILSAATIGILGRVRKVDMALWEAVRIRHVHTRSGRKQDMQISRDHSAGSNGGVYDLVRLGKC